MSVAKAKLAPSTVNRIARLAEADVRTVRKMLTGQAVRGRVGDRIAAEIERERRLGILAPA